MKVSAWGLAMLILWTVPCPSAQASIDAAKKPEWTPGDFWEYSASETILNGTFTYTNRVEVTSIDELVVRGRTWPVYNATETLTVTSPIDSGSVVTRTWYRTTDLALVRFEAIDGTLVGLYDPPIDIRWPLRVGEWNGSTTEVVEGGWSREGPVAYRFAVTDGGVRSTPAGTFETFRVEKEVHTDSGTSREITYYSPLVGNTVETSSMNPIPDLRLSRYLFRNAPGPAPLAIGLIGFATVLTTAVTVWMLRRRGTRKEPALVPSSDETNSKTIPDSQTFKARPRMPPP